MGGGGELVERRRRPKEWEINAIDNVFRISSSSPTSTSCAELLSLFTVSSPLAAASSWLKIGAISEKHFSPRRGRLSDSKFAY